MRAPFVRVTPLLKLPQPLSAAHCNAAKKTKEDGTEISADEGKGELHRLVLDWKVYGVGWNVDGRSHRSGGDLACAGSGGKELSLKRCIESGKGKKQPILLPLVRMGVAEEGKFSSIEWVPTVTGSSNVKSVRQIFGLTHTTDTVREMPLSAAAHHTQVSQDPTGTNPS